MLDSTVTHAKRRIIQLLKRHGPTTAGALARELNLTEVAVRQHLNVLQSAGFARSRRQASSRRGRPSQQWELTEQAGHLFPDRHGQLTVDLLDAIRRAIGDRGLERVIRERARTQVTNYRLRLPPNESSLLARVEALASYRTAEGYMAEVIVERPGSYLLVEHHCPVCYAARCCQRLCGAELEVFREALGKSITVERTEHVLSGSTCCAYRIAKR